jgi:ferredoxin
MRVVVEANICMGSGNCVAECPEVFAQDENGVVVVLEEAPADELRDRVEQAAAECPSQCISVDD